MKLTIEQKAKRYDEAIEIARKIKDGESIDTPDGTVIPVVIFPELKEDEDEFTWLKNYISEEVHYLSMDIRDYEDRLKLQKLQKSLAWLEKQCEKEWDEEDEHKVKNIIYFFNSAKVHYASDVELNGCIRWLWSLIQRMGR